MGLAVKLKKITITTAGTAVPVLAGSHDVVGAVIQAGTNIIYVGDSAVSATNGIELSGTSKEKISIPGSNANVLDLGTVFLDASANGSIAYVLYFLRL